MELFLLINSNQKLQQFNIFVQTQENIFKSLYYLAKSNGGANYLLNNSLVLNYF